MFYILFQAVISHISDSRLKTHALRNPRVTLRRTHNPMMLRGLLLLLLFCVQCTPDEAEYFYLFLFFTSADL